MCNPYSQNSERQLFDVVWIEGSCLQINVPMLGLEAGFHPTSDTMLCYEQKRQDIHVEYSIYGIS